MPEMVAGDLEGGTDEWALSGPGALGPHAHKAIAKRPTHEGRLARLGFGTAELPAGDATPAQRGRASREPSARSRRLTISWCRARSKGFGIHRRSRLPMRERSHASTFIRSGPGGGCE